MVNGSGCFCNQGFYWNSSSRQCIINCSGDPNSNGTANGTNRCFCKSNYLWNGTLCARNCTGVLNSNGQYNSINVAFCDCITDYMWNNSVQVCVLNCSKFINTTVNNGVNACFCITGYKWVAATKTCVISCSGIANSNGTANGSNSCFCLQGYSWVNGGCSQNCAPN